MVFLTLVVFYSCYQKVNCVPQPPKKLLFAATRILVINVINKLFCNPLITFYRLYLTKNIKLAKRWLKVISHQENYFLHFMLN